MLRSDRMLALAVTCFLSVPSLQALPSAAETAKVVAFASSDLALSMTGATLNATCGLVLD